jgi:mannosyl-3-phosphoglycerate phosphatase
MPKPLPPVIVFADIDAAPTGPTAEHDRLAAVLERLAASRITLVFCSHRTRAEVERIRQALGVYHPFVCEDGSVAFVPERYFGADPENARVLGGYRAMEFAQPYHHVVETLHRVAARLGLAVLGFKEMPVEQVARECGLSLLAARLAKLREYAEPFRLVVPNPTAERRLLRSLESAGLICVRHGDFHYAATVHGADAAAAALTALYRVSFGSVVTAVLGDSAATADIARRTAVRLASPRGEAQSEIEWLERIVQRVEDYRDTLMLTAAARQAR